MLNVNLLTDGYIHALPHNYILLIKLIDTMNYIHFTDDIILMSL